MARSFDTIIDDWLVLEAQAGDQDAWRLLVERWHPRLIAVAGRHVGSSAAHDVVQDAWLGVAKGLGRLRDPARFAPFCYRILLRRCADCIRRDRREKTMAIEFDPPARSPEDSDTALVREALRRLSAADRFLLTLRHADGLSIAAIAEITRLRPGTVKSRLFAARERLRTLLESEKGDSV